jgi:Fe-S-cluster containining protein
VGKAEQRRQDKARALAKADERRRVVLRVYQGCEDSAARTLERLRITPTCVAGCSHCCNLEIPMSRAEGETIVAWLTENATPETLAAIRERLRAWLVWYRTDYPKLVASGISRVDAFFRHAPPCALLDGDRCTAYPVRPITCRNHLVSSPVAECDPAVGRGDPTLILDVARASFDHVAELRALIDNQGGSYIASIHLIGEWLAHLLEVEREPWVGAPPLELG